MRVSTLMLCVHAYRFNEFGVDGGPAAKALKPKFNVFSKSVTSHTGLEVPEFDIKYLVAAAVAFKSLFYLWQRYWSLSSGSATGHCYSYFV
ncbi:hypothetical protein HRI_005190900 [Hibiscus trionum]|uniref:Uncharacterized protein n=1 Tax=Hibiscus trionum TaxID=183268 RepID=A0A9W7JH37_HIBTR|nr:hypothetical protein HRI_005190900 [Hibiscus trionum]